MIQSLRPYPAYKDSGVPWLGKVPEHWTVRRIKSVFREKDKRSGDGSGLLLSLTRARGLLPQSEASTRVASAADLSKYKICRLGDLVMNRMQAWSGMFAVSPCEGLVSPDYSVFTTLGHYEVRFFEQLFKIPMLVEQFAQASKGIGSGFNRLYTPDFGAVPVAVPALPEQAAIVRFIDHADRRIKRYIRAKQKLLKLLEEQKQAIIHRAVTRGLDPNVRLKPSGVEWLGDVPEHWTLARLKDAAVVQTGLTLGKNYKSQKTESRPYLRVANVQVGRVDLRHVKCLDVPSHEARGATLRAGDVLMTEGGDIDKLGRGCVWRDEISECLHQNHVFAVRCQKAVLIPEFLVGLMASNHGRAYFQLTAKQTTNLASTNSSTLRAFPIFLPPIPEQRDILNEIGKQSEGVVAAIGRAEREIWLLREYRTRLIADVVTGKLDVRAAAKLPDETGESEMLDEAEATLEDDDKSEGADLDAVTDEVEA